MDIITNLYTTCRAGKFCPDLLWKEIFKLLQKSLFLGFLTSSKNKEREKDYQKEKQYKMRSWLPEAPKWSISVCWSFAGHFHEKLKKNQNSQNTLMRFPCADFLSFSRSLWVAPLSPGVSEGCCGELCIQMTSITLPWSPMQTLHHSSPAGWLDRTMFCFVRNIVPRSIVTKVLGV